MSIKIYVKYVKNNRDFHTTKLNLPTGALDSHASQVLLETFCRLNEMQKATILMVTHDAFSASYCSRILFLRDGKIFHELIRGERNRRAFLQEILDVLSLMGGESSHDTKTGLS